VHLVLVGEAPDTDTLFSHVLRFHKAAEYAASACDDSVDTGLLRCGTGGIKATFVARALECRDALLKAILAHSAAEAQSITANYTSIIERLQLRPKNEQELLAAKQFLRSSEAVAEFLEGATATIHARAEECGRYAYQVPAEDIAAAWALKEWPLRVALVTREMLESLESDRTAMIAALDAAKVAFASELEALEVKCAAFKDCGAGATDLADPASVAELGKIVARTNELDGELRAAMERGDDINAREGAFGFSPTAYSNLKSMQEDVEPFSRLWLALAEFVAKKEAWTTTSLLEVDAGEVERDVMDWWTMSYRQMKSVGEGYPGALGAAKACWADGEELLGRVPICIYILSFLAIHTHLENSVRVSPTMQHHTSANESPAQLHDVVVILRLLGSGGSQGGLRIELLGVVALLGRSCLPGAC
jgi:hypothetical protein